jgi:hypothetical protein
MGKSVPISLHAHALALLEEGVNISRIQERKGLSQSAIYSVRKRAYERGNNSDNNFIFKDDFFADVQRSGRQKDMDEDKEGS